MSYAIIVTCLGVLLALPAAAAPVDTICPPAIELAETLNGPDAAWEQIADHDFPDHALEAIRVYSGHPNQQVRLMPDKIARLSGKTVSTWSLPHIALQGYWVACAYRNSSTLLAKALPVAAASCRMAQKSAVAGTAPRSPSFVCE